LSPTIFTIRPGWLTARFCATPTAFTPADKQMPPELIDKASSTAATQTITHPDDVARMIVFLCSAANTNTTGEAIRTDGHFLSPT
jgi:3-oxoacyl-[acyl-carrier protein] reductase